MNKVAGESHNTLLIRPTIPNTMNDESLTKRNFMSKIAVATASIATVPELFGSAFACPDQCRRLR
tara:strand:+ start:245 stop:439 length:195 start_codon:yes stop_codon:yes gene_type:complete